MANIARGRSLSKARRPWRLIPRYTVAMPPTDHSAVDPLVDAARRAAQNAHAPYSGWHVGAAAVFAEAAGPPFVGANVENGSYGLSICAERTAISAGVVAGHRRLVRLALTCSDATGTRVAGIVPCGACLQVIAEFGTPDTEIVIDGGGGFRLADFLPRPFGTGVTVPRRGT
jgi:cytidine deaminase